MSKESQMVVRSARCTKAGAAVAAALGMAASLLIAAAAPTSAQTAQPPAADKPESAQPAPAAATPITPEGLATKPSDPFGEEVTLAAKPIVFVKGSGTWDQAFTTISGALKTVEAYVAKAGLKTDGLPMTIFTATDDKGFDYQAAIPLAAPPKDPPQGEVQSGQSPAGRALEFVHRGSYDALDDTYEAINNYLDDKQLESRNILIEQYVTDPATADEKNLVVQVLVLVK
jgi:effector-binding domain-containing protein